MEFYKRMPLTEKESKMEMIKELIGVICGDIGLVGVTIALIHSVAAFNDKHYPIYLYALVGIIEAVLVPVYYFGMNDLDKKVVVEEGQLKVYMKRFGKYVLTKKIELSDIKYICQIKQSIDSKIINCATVTLTGTPVQIGRGKKMKEELYYIIDKKDKKIQFDHIKGNESLFTSLEGVPLFTYLKETYNIDVVFNPLKNALQSPYMLAAIIAGLIYLIKLYMESM